MSEEVVLVDADEVALWERIVVVIQSRSTLVASSEWVASKATSLVLLRRQRLLDNWRSRTHED